MEKIVYLSLGSNLGDREANLREAIERLQQSGTVTKVSSLYETKPVDVLDQPWFLNCAVELKTEKMPRQLISAVLQVERDMGRRRLRAKGPRVIDIDILLFGSSVIEMEQLTVPHPAMHLRRFVLAPLAEIAPAARHPVLKKTASQMLTELEPGSPAVRKASVRSGKHS